MPENNQPEPEEAPAVQRTVDGEVEAKANGTNAESDKKKSTRPLKRFERYQVILGFAAAVLGAFGLWIVNRQTTIMEAQLKVSEEAVGQGRTALDASIEQLRLDQRAWVGPTSFALPECVKDGKPVLVAAGCNPSFGAYIVNSGKTIAKEYVAIVRAFMAFTNKPFVARYEDVPDPSVSVLQPGMMVASHSKPFKKAFVDNQIKAIQEDVARVYFHGKITYVDIFAEKHFATFCMYVSRDLTHLNACSTYNDAN